MSSRQWSGCRTRWWVSAALAPSTRAQPHRGALVVGDLGEHRRARRRRPASSSASTSRSRPSSAASGSARRGELVGERLARRRRAARCPRGRAARRRSRSARTSPRVDVIAAPPRSRRTAATSGRHCASSAGSASSIAASTTCSSRPSATRSSRSSAAQPVTTSVSTSGCDWIPHARGAEAGDLHLAAGRPRQDHAALGQGHDDVVVPVDRAARRRCARRPSASSAASALQPTGCSPTVWPRGFADDLAAEGDGQHLVAQADPEQRRAGGDRVADAAP